MMSTLKDSYTPSILNDVIGPVMRGPSSSHTAASWRMAVTGLQLLDDELDQALIELEEGSIWASNYREQGTALGMNGGLLGLDMSDEAMLNTGPLAKARGIRIIYQTSRFETEHTNTLRITLRGKTGRSVQLKAISSGGGMFSITSCNGHAIDLKGDSYDLILQAGPEFDPSYLDPIFEASQVKTDVQVSAHHREKLVQVKAPLCFDAQIRKKISSLSGIQQVSLIEPLLPVLSGKASSYRFSDLPGLLEFAQAKDYSLGELGLIYESDRSGLTRAELMSKMLRLISIIEEGIKKGLAGTSYGDRILHRQSHLIGLASRQKKIGTDVLVNRIISNISALMEVKSAMELIVAVPTAGSCGTFGGSIKAFADTRKLEPEDQVMAYFAGGLVGVFFAQGPGFSAEEYGCQVETGAAGCMAAAALTDLSGGHFLESLAAASIALQNSIGLVCDPVADRVEVPCLGKNIAAGMNALAASTMALSGYDPLIPLDQVLDTVEKVGKALPSTLCNSGMGGLAQTPKARQIKEALFRSNRHADK